MRKIWWLFTIALVLGGSAAVFWFFSRYKETPTTRVAVEEVTAREYPNDPAAHSIAYNRYADRELWVVEKAPGIYDFIFESKNPHVATIIFRNIDVALFVPAIPDWARVSEELERVTAVEREWNRQQVALAPNSPHFEVHGGDGFEVKKLSSAELARNCLHAGLWEVLLFTREGGQKKLYYQGWFQFPLGQYKKVYEMVNKESYWKHWFSLEHWVDPSGTPIRLSQLRDVLEETRVPAQSNPNEPIFAAGEQARKVRNLLAKNMVSWRDLWENSQIIQFATFRPPGRYSTSHPWGNELHRLRSFGGAVVRRVHSRQGSRSLDEVELLFDGPKGTQETRMLLSGLQIDELPRLPSSRYTEGKLVALGIAVPPPYQTYNELKENPPLSSPYFGLLLDENNRWINHHRIAIDGAILHLDDQQPHILHIYPLSYERHSLVGHYTLNLSHSHVRPTREVGAATRRALPGRN